MKKRLRLCVVYPVFFSLFFFSPPPLLSTDTKVVDMKKIPGAMDVLPSPLVCRKQTTYYYPLCSETLLG